MTAENPMPERGTSAFLEVSEALNENLRALAQALQAGAAPASLVQRSRAEALAGLARLRALPPGGPGAENVSKVEKHLDLFVTLADAIEASPALSAKLLEHLLEEQVEITAEEAAAAHVSPPPRAPSAPADSTPTALGGGRKPLTVGSLIGR
jgi:hypothetical protein